MMVRDRDKRILVKANKLDKMKIVVYVLGGVVAILALVSLILLIDGIHEEQGYILLKLSIIAAIVLVFVGDLIQNKSKNLKCIYKKKCREELVPSVLQSIFDPVVYNPEGGFSSQYIVDMDLLGLPAFPSGGVDKHISSWNYVYAKYKEVLFKCADIKIYASSKNKILFYGRIMELHYPSYDSAKLKIYSRNFYDVKNELFPHKSGKIQITGVKFFDNEFKMRCDNEEQFKTIMTSEMMEKLELFHNLYNQFAIEFYNDKLYVALDMSSWKSDPDTYMRRESFEPDYSKDADYQCQIKKIKKDTKFITDTIDIFCRDLR